MINSSPLQGVVFGIQHFSIHDGEGIRSNVFLKGCPMHCLWCHNPEGLSPKCELQYYANQCTGCGKCGHIYRHMDQLADQPLAVKKEYAAKCPYKAIEMVGRYMTVEQVMDEVGKDRFFSRPAAVDSPLQEVSPCFRWILPVNC
ncbi:MAG: 4Fe-4S cluster-binding domain-containing protein [Clostridiales bacterium]|nr:4Fe-4S cluster-binding domain-containing protein [Clostridiales bacterium]